jgi:ribosomal protein L13E
MKWFRGSQPPALLDPQATCGRSVVQARGYSLLELERAGIDEPAARGLSIPVDPVRASALGSNVLQLRQFLSRRANH